MAQYSIGTDGDDRGLSTGSQHQFGLDGNDTIMATDFADSFLYGGRGTDNLFGAGGDDLLFGGRGRDTLVGNQGHDVMRGGKGMDIFAVEGGDLVLDFTPGVDKLAVGFIADPNGAMGRYDPATGRLFADLDGAGPDFEILVAYLKKGLAISDADFLT